MSTLRELIEQATPGPWGHGPVSGDVVAFRDANTQLVVCEPMDGHWDTSKGPKYLPVDERAANAALIARLNPQTALLVLDAIEDTISKINDAAAGKINFRDDFAYRLELALKALNGTPPTA